MSTTNTASATKNVIEITSRSGKKVGEISLLNALHLALISTGDPTGSLHSYPNGELEPMQKFVEDVTAATLTGSAKFLKKLNFIEFVEAGSVKGWKQRNITSDGTKVLNRLIEQGNIDQDILDTFTAAREEFRAGLTTKKAKTVRESAKIRIDEIDDEESSDSEEAVEVGASIEE